MDRNHIITQLANVNSLSLRALNSYSGFSPEIYTMANQFNEQRQKQFLGCRFLLAEILKQHFMYPTLPAIVIADNSRPIFLDANLPDFNISHSGDYIAVAVAKSGKIGLDIEQHRPRKNLDKITNNFFSSQEIHWLHQQSDKLAAFWQLWTLRESALKLYAKGVWQMKEMSIEPNSLQIEAPFGEAFYCHYQYSADVHLSISCNQPIAHLCSN